MNQTKQKRLSLQVLGLVTISLLGYQNCAPGALSAKGSATNASSGGSYSDCGGSVCEVPDVQTIAISDSQNVMAGMLAKAGVTPSANTNRAFTAQAGKLPESGNVSQITAPAWMAIATMGSEVCNDLLTQELAAGAVRRIFNSVDFTKGPASVDANAKNDVVRRLARNFWGRNESAQELMLIKGSLDESFSGATVADTRKEMLFLCTAMIASTDAQKY